MTAPEPRTWPDPLTPFRHNEAIARVIMGAAPLDQASINIANRLRTTDDPDAQAALAANLPREVMLAALVADGTLGKEEAGGCSDGTPSQWVESVRYVTDWETTT